MDSSVQEGTPIQEAFRFCPKCGAPSAAIGKIPYQCPQCGFSFYFGPVAAVGGLILNDNDEMLLVRRARNPGLGKWGLPGGFVDRDETIEEALAREIREETKLELREQELLTTFPNSYHYQGIVAPVIDLFYVCRVDDLEKIQLEPDELDTFEWTGSPVSFADEMAFESNRRAIEFWQSKQEAKPS
ncbi:MAG: NUDIX domain-containing protein [Planctomycetota bacterium]